ncbi:MAG: hypothetical protein R2706_19950 [Acidimicrobiales bacterium]
MAPVLSYESNADNERSTLLRTAIAEHRNLPERLVSPPELELASDIQQAGNPIVGLVWATMLSVPLWALIGLGLRVLAKAV